MTIVAGKIEPLKKIKKILNEKGITRFNSIGDINTFITNYEYEKKAIPKVIETKLDKEINHLQSIIIKQEKIHDFLKTEAQNNLHRRIIIIEKELKNILEKSKGNLFYKIFYYLKIKKFDKEIASLKNDSENIIQEETKDSAQKVIDAKHNLENHIENKKKIISDRCTESYQELGYLKEVIDELYTLIAGAVGENLTVNELQKLSNSYYLINDFTMEFNPPIYNKKNNDKIFSIQIDHLLISPSGVFILETKNWSKNSINNLDLRSPVEQILRTSYALFVLLNSESNIDLVLHHWGSKKIPIRNIIVMTNEKPKEQFKHVKVLSLNELNGYIKYFDEVFSKTELEDIFNYLKNICL